MKLQAARPHRPLRLRALPRHDDLRRRRRGIWGKIGQLQQDDAERIVGSALDAGINFIDTADVYAGGRSEAITGQALNNLKVPRESVVVATKVFGETGPGPNARGATRGHIVAGAARRA